MIGDPGLPTWVVGKWKDLKEEEVVFWALARNLTPLLSIVVVLVTFTNWQFSFAKSYPFS